MRRIGPPILAIACLFVAAEAFALGEGDDARMVVEVLADAEKPGQSLHELHADLPDAAQLALRQLLDRLIPRNSLARLPSKMRAVRFLQRAEMTDNGVRIHFHSGLLKAYLEEHHIPYIPEQPRFDLEIRLFDASGQEMAQTAALLKDFAAQQAIRWGYALSDAGDALILRWRWLDGRQVSFTLRGVSRLGERQEMRILSPGDPLPQLRQWLLDVLLEARDAYAKASADVQADAALAAAPMVADGYADPYANAAFPANIERGVLIRVERVASLPEQVLFEEDLRRDPHVASLRLTQIHHALRQYRLELRDDADEDWLGEWFAAHGYQLSPTEEGWLAR